MPVLKTAAERAAFPTICPIHGIPFMQFESRQSGRLLDASMGCPICVAKIRADVQREFATHRKWGVRNYGRKPRTPNAVQVLPQGIAPQRGTSRKVKTGS